MARPGISTKNTEKIPPGPKFWTPRIYPQNTPKIPKKYPQNTQNAHFWYFFGIFGVFSWGSRISAQGVFFRYFSWKFRVGPSRGSVALNSTFFASMRIEKQQRLSSFGRWGWGPRSVVPSVKGATCTPLDKPAKSKRGREEGDRTENVINCRDVCRKLS